MAELKTRYVFDWHRIFAEDGYHIEYSVTDICNRNCASCSHLAPLAKHPNFVTAEAFAHDVRIMRRVVPDAHTFWLTGGEPTLHPGYMELLRVLRNTYPDCYVGIYSNGLTLRARENDADFWKFVREADIVWAVTNYEIPREYFEELFAAHGCANYLAIVQSGSTFAKLTNYARDQSVSREKYIKCGWERSKINIRNGRIYNCPSSEFADLFNGFYGEDLKVTENDYLAIDEDLTRHRLEDFRGPMPFCGQCDINARHHAFPNRPSARDKLEWSDSGPKIEPISF